jgi:hypothetical protein
MGDIKVFKDVRELKRFILWCKTNKINKFKAQEIEFEISELGLIETIKDPEIAKIEEIITKSDISEEKDQEDNEALYWSAGPQKI